MGTVSSANLRKKIDLRKNYDTPLMLSGKESR